MNQHLFLFMPGRWIGQGKITVIGAPEVIRFCTDWRIEGDVKDIIYCKQRVEMSGVEEVRSNYFTISSVVEDAFIIDMESEFAEKTRGKGAIDATSISWSFYGIEENALRGKELYELQSNGDYLLHGEYLSDGVPQISIEARIWQKN